MYKKSKKNTGIYCGIDRVSCHGSDRNIICTVNIVQKTER